MTTVIVFAIIIATFLIYLKLASVAGFSMVSKLNGCTLTGKGGLIPDFVKTWWNNDDEKWKTMHYIILLVLAFVVYGVASIDWFGLKPYQWAGIFAIIGYHVIWTKYSGKSGLFTKLIVHGMLSFFVLAWLVYGVVEIRNAGYSIAETKINKVGKEMSAFAEEYACNNDSPKCTPEIKARVLESPSGKKSHPSSSHQSKMGQPILLTAEWSERIRPTPGKPIHYSCSQASIMMRLYYDGWYENGEYHRGNHSSFPSGASASCGWYSQEADDKILLASASYDFRDPDGDNGATATVSYR